MLISVLQFITLIIHTGTDPTRVIQIGKDCQEGATSSGVYKIQPDGAEEPFSVYCDMETDGGGWTVS